MKILIATGIFKPELGGPATLSMELARRLQATGHEVTVLTYSDHKQYPFDRELTFKVVRIVRRNKLLNYYQYFKKAVKEMAEHDVTYSLDWFSGGLPIMLAAGRVKKPYIVRVGGGYIWEKYLAEGRPPVTLKEFYARKLYRKYWLMYWLIKKVFKNAVRVVFNSDVQCALYEKYYQIDHRKTLIIYNAIPENRFSSLVSNYNITSETRDRELVFAGRFIKMKNVESLIKAFAKLSDSSFRLLLIGEGPLKQDLLKLVSDLKLSNRIEFLPSLSQSELYKRIAHCYAVIIPSWTDISPHQAYECLSLGIPFLITRENYLPINQKYLVTFDPSSVDDLVEKLNKLLDSEIYKKFVSDLTQIDFHHSWTNVVAEHLKLFLQVSKNYHDCS